MLASRVAVPASRVAALASRAPVLASRVAALVSRVLVLARHVSALASRVTALASRVPVLARRATALASRLPVLVSRATVLASHLPAERLGRYAHRRGAPPGRRRGRPTRALLMYALDTNSVVYFFKGLGRVAERLLATPPAEVALPAVVLYELELGVAKSNAPERRRAQLAELVRRVRILPFGADEARVTAHIRADLERAGQPMGPIDLLIAGTALHQRAILVTHNRDELGRVGGLSLEDWY